MVEKQNQLERRSRQERGPGEIRSEIERTRAKMGETVNAIEREIGPDRFRWGMLKNIQAAGDYAEQRAKSIGSFMVEQTKTTKLPAALLVIGISWLLIGMTRKRKTSEPDIYMKNL